MLLQRVIPGSPVRHAATGRRGGNVALLAVLLIMILLPCASAAWAQQPLAAIPEPGPGGPHATMPAFNFTRVSIPDLPDGTSLGAMWTPAEYDVHLDPALPTIVVPDPPEPGDGSETRIPGALYVWAIRTTSPVGTGAYAAVPEPGGPSEPGEPGGGVVSSTLYVWNGSGWAAVLTLPHMIGHQVFGTGATDVYATAVSVHGKLQMFHQDGSGWREQVLPPLGGTDAGSMDGRAGDIWFRADGKVLHLAGGIWSVDYAEPALKGGGALVYIGPDEVYAIGPKGYSFLKGGLWRYVSAPSLVEVNHAWGERAAGGLRLYATGSIGADGAMRVWRFTEDFVGSGTGSWGSADGLAIPSLVNGGGDGLAISGGPTGSLFAVGTHCGHGELVVSDGSTWITSWQDGEYPVPNDIISTVDGHVWLTLSSGQLVHGTPRTEASPQGPLAGSDRGPLPLIVVPRGGASHEFVVTLPEAAELRLAAFDVSGRRVATIDQGHQDAGAHSFVWDASGVPSGLYFCRVTAGGRAVTKTVIVRL